MAYTVLLIEDDPTYANLVIESLQKKLSQKINVTNCNCYEQAFGYLFSQKWNLVMINYHLPTRNGLETLKTFKALMDEWKTPTIVYNTSYGAEDIEEEITQEKATIFSHMKDVFKPEGIETIRSFLENN